MDLLGDYRTEIDKIDKEMTKLLEKRMNISKSISKYKMEHDMQIFHPEREKIVIEKNKGYLENKEYGDLVESYYDNLMYLSRLVQQKEIYSENNIYTKPYKNDRENLVVGYQGVPGSFGNEAMLKYFKNIKKESEIFIENFNSPIEVLRHLKNTGVTGFEKTEIKKIRSFSSAELTYKVGYFLCEK